MGYGRGPVEEDPDPDACVGPVLQDVRYLVRVIIVVEDVGAQVDGLPGLVKRVQEPGEKRLAVDEVLDRTAGRLRLGHLIQDLLEFRQVHARPFVQFRDRDVGYPVQGVGHHRVLDGIDGQHEKLVDSGQRSDDHPQETDADVPQRSRCG